MRGRGEEGGEQEGVKGFVEGQVGFVGVEFGFGGGTACGGGREGVGEDLGGFGTLEQTMRDGEGQWTGDGKRGTKAVGLGLTMKAL